MRDTGFQEPLVYNTREWKTSDLNCTLNAFCALFFISIFQMKAESTLDGGAKSSGECKESESSVDLLFASGVKGNLDFKFTLGADSNVMMDLALTFTPDSIFSNGDNGML